MRYLERMFLLSTIDALWKDRILPRGWSPTGGGGGGNGLLLRARREANLTRRVDLYRRAEELILEDAPVIPILHYTYERLFQPYVRSVEVNGLGAPYIPLRKIWLERKP